MTGAPETGQPKKGPRLASRIVFGLAIVLASFVAMNPSIEELVIGGAAVLVLVSIAALIEGWRPRYSWKALIIFTIVAGAGIGLAVRWHFKGKAADAIFRAALDGDIETVKWCLSVAPELVDARVPGEAKTSDLPWPDDLGPAGATPLHLAAGAPPAGPMIYLDGEKATVAVGMAIRRSRNAQKCLEVAKALIAAGADVNARDRYGKTPLFYAGSSKIADLLVAHGGKE